MGRFGILSKPSSAELIRCETVEREILPKGEKSWFEAVGRRAIGDSRRRRRGEAIIRCLSREAADRAAEIRRRAKNTRDVGIRNDRGTRENAGAGGTS